MPHDFIRIPAAAASPNRVVWGDHYVENVPLPPNANLQQERNLFLRKQREVMEDGALAGYTTAIYHKSVRQNGDPDVSYHINTVAMTKPGSDLAHLKQVVAIHDAASRSVRNGPVKYLDLHAEDLPVLLRDLDQWPRYNLETLVVNRRAKGALPNGIVTEEVNIIAPEYHLSRPARLVLSFQQRIEAAKGAFMHPERFLQKTR